MYDWFIKIYVRCGGKKWKHRKENHANRHRFRRIRVSDSDIDDDHDKLSTPPRRQNNLVASKSGKRKRKISYNTEWEKNIYLVGFVKARKSLHEARQNATKYWQNTGESSENKNFKRPRQQTIFHRHWCVE